MKPLIAILALLAPVSLLAAPTVLDCVMNVTGITYIVQFDEDDMDAQLLFNSEKFYSVTSRLKGHGSKYNGTYYEASEIMVMNGNLIEFGQSILDRSGKRNIWSASISRTTGAITITGPRQGVGQCEQASRAQKF
jgi:hypothetical protein